MDFCPSQCYNCGSTSARYLWNIKPGLDNLCLFSVAVAVAVVVIVVVVVVAVVVAGL